MSTHLRNSRIPPSPTSPELESSGAEGRPAHPASDGDGESRHTQHDEGIHAGDLRAPCVDVLVGDDGRGEADRRHRCDYRGAEVDEAALAPKVEEAVPGQDVRCLLCGCRVAGG